jgi:hypothetical protein
MNNTFKEMVYKIAFGDNAINKGYSDKEVLDKLLEHSQELIKFKNKVINTIDRLFEENS